MDEKVLLSIVNGIRFVSSVSIISYYERDRELCATSKAERTLQVRYIISFGSLFGENPKSITIAGRAEKVAIF